MIRKPSSSCIIPCLHAQNTSGNSAIGQDSPYTYTRQEVTYDVQAGSQGVSWWVTYAHHEYAALLGMAVTSRVDRIGVIMLVLHKQVVVMKHIHEVP